MIACKKEKHIRHPRITAAKEADTIFFGHYPQEKDGSDMTPIEWLVIDREGNKALLLSYYGLDEKPYHNECLDVTWETCSQRKWLNETFITTAFNQVEREAILVTNVDNSNTQGNPRFKGVTGGNNTVDKIFLLSFAEAKKYFFRNTDRKCYPTSYANARGVITSISYSLAGKYTGMWWLRSPSSRQNCAALIGIDGAGSGDLVSSHTRAVRPALWVDLEKIKNQ